MHVCRICGLECPEFFDGKRTKKKKKPDDTLIYYCNNCGIMVNRKSENMEISFPLPRVNEKLEDFMNPANWIIEDNNDYSALRNALLALNQ